MKTKYSILASIYWQISFEKYVPSHLIRLLYNFYFIFLCHYFIIKKTNSKKRIHPQSRSFERRICAQTQDLHIFKKFNISQMKPKEVSHNTAYSVQLPYIAGHSL